MSSANDLQEAIEWNLSAPVPPSISFPDRAIRPALRVAVKIIQRRPLEMKSDIEAAAAQMSGLCIYVMPPIPLSVQDGEGMDFVFVDRGQILVRITEIIPLNTSGADAYDLMDDVMTALQGRPYGFPHSMEDNNPLNGIIADPLRLAKKPCNLVEGNLRGADDKTPGPRVRIIDVFFETAYQLNS